jgi:CheY-like chemotaxis protein
VLYVVRVAPDPSDPRDGPNRAVGESRRQGYLHGRRILVVEDDADSRFLLEYYVERAGGRALLAHDGHHAIALLDSAEVDLILTDLMMPRVDGRALLEIVKQHPQLAPIPVIAVTASSTDRQTLLVVGFAGHVQKPVFPEALEAELRRVLG